MQCRLPRRIGFSTSVDYAENFADNDWATIAAVCSKGLVPATWKIGDQKAMTINGTSYPIDIIGIQHDELADGSGKAPFTFQMHDCYGTNYRLNGAADNTAGYDGTEMHTTTLPSFKALLPSEVQAAIKPVSKFTSIGNTSATIEAIACDLFLLSEVEVFGSVSNSKAGEGVQYAYYSKGNSKIKYKAGTATAWWGRSPYKSSTSHFCYVYNDGTTNYGGPATARGLSFAFCLGNGVSGGSGGGGSSSSEYAVTIEDATGGILSASISDGDRAIKVGNTEISKTGTYTANNGSALTISQSLGSWTNIITVNGTVVKTTSESVWAYSYPITANTKLVYSENNSAEECVWTITTE